ncbi:MAG: hypothetical protein ABIH87_02210 [bacterium]
MFSSLNKILVIFVILGGVLLFSSQAKMAVGSKSDNFGLESTAGYAEVKNLAISKEIKTPSDLIKKIVNISLSFLAVIFFALLSYGGFIWMKALGNTEDTERAKDIIQAAMIGLIIVLFAYGITYFVFSNMAGQT